VVVGSGGHYADERKERSMGTKDKGGSKDSKKPAQKDIKEKRKSKKMKKAASGR
jgi:hypothetical protein